MADREIFFATNRSYRPDAAGLFDGTFNPDGVSALRFGRVGYDLSGRDPKRGAVHLFPEAKAGAGEDRHFSSVGSVPFLEAMRTAMAQGSTDTLIFIHGYNVTFLEALDAGARLAAAMSIGGKTLNVVVFSWPSEGQAIPFMSYYSDREDARACGGALARAYLKLLDYLAALRRDQDCGRSLHLLCHSMGNYVLRHGLQALIAKEPRQLARLFGEIVMAAPDEDDDAFELDTKLRLLPRLARRVSLYHHENDRALILSDRTKANPDRLGSNGPRMLDLLPKKVVAVDCSRVAGEGDRLIQHSYFLRCPPVLADIAQTLGGVPSDGIGGREPVRAERAYRIRPAPPPP